jgi:hypothetical protein
MNFYSYGKCSIRLAASYFESPQLFENISQLSHNYYLARCYLAMLRSEPGLCRCIRLLCHIESHLDDCDK